MDKLAVLIIIALVIVITVLVVRQNKDKLFGLFEIKKGPKKNPDAQDLKNILRAVSRRNGNSSNTIILGRGTIQQLDSRTGGVISEFTVDYSEDPICISKPSSTRRSYINQLVVSDNPPETKKMSSNAYYLTTENEKGELSLVYRDGIKTVKDYLWDTETKNVINPIFVYNHETGKIIKFTNVDEYIPLADGQLFSLGGEQWFRYLKPRETGDIDPRIFIRGADKSVNNSSVKADGPAVSPLREATRTYEDKKAYSPLNDKEPEKTHQRTRSFTFNKEDGVNC